MALGYLEKSFRAQDGLELYYRDYGNPLAMTIPVLCLAGLTRNAIDFHDLALHLSRKRRIISLDLRGRGRSEYDPNPNNYTPHTYLSDVTHLLTVTNCHKVVVIGTSLGGLIAMALGAVRPTTLAGVVLNDIGPEIDPVGVQRISSYAGKNLPAMNLEQATEHMENLFAAAYPEFGPDQWRKEAMRGLHQREDGLWVSDYDPAIVKTVSEQAHDPQGFWPYFNSLKNVPVLALRGELSDILNAKTFAAMVKAKPDLLQVTVPNRGHTPDLSEPVSIEAIDKFLETHGKSKN